MTMNPWTARQMMEARQAELRRAARHPAPQRRPARTPRSRGRPSAFRLRFAGWLIRTGQRVAGPALPVEEVLALGGMAGGVGGDAPRP